MLEIKDFWKSYYKKIKNYNEKENEGLFIDSREVLARDIILDLEVKNKIRPKWLKKDERVPIFYKKIFKNKLNGEVIASFRQGKITYPAIVKKNKKIIFNFNPEETIMSLLSEKYYKPKRRFYTYLPFHFHMVPVKIRLILKRILFIKKVSTFPSWPIEKSVELLRYIIMKSSEIATGEKIKNIKWPKNKKYVVCLTHDVETKRGFKKIPLLLRTEEKYKLKSSWGIVSNHYKLDYSLLSDLINKNYEIYLHGYKHDNKLIYLSKNKIKKRFERMEKLKNKFNIKGFRSPCLLRSDLLFEILEDNHYMYDSSTPDTEIMSQISERNGCCTVFPYSVGNLVRIPLTLPQDATLFFQDFSEKEVKDIWIQKLEFIKKLGGVAVINTHPEMHLTANKRNLKIYEEILKYISKDNTAWVALLSDVASYSKKLISKDI